MTDSHSLNEYRFDVTAFLGAEHYRKSRSIAGRRETPAWLNPRRLRVRDRAFRKATEPTRSRAWHAWSSRATGYGRLAIATRGRVVSNGDANISGFREGTVPEGDSGFVYGQAFAVQVFATDRETAHAQVKAAFDVGVLNDVRNASVRSIGEGREGGNREASRRVNTDGGQIMERRDIGARVSRSAPASSAQMASDSGLNTGSGAIMPPASGPSVPQSPLSSKSQSQSPFDLFTGYRIEPFDPFRGEGCAIAAEFDRLRAAFVERHRDDCNPGVIEAGSNVETDRHPPGEKGSVTAEATVRRTTLLGDYGAGHHAGVIWADLTSGPPARERAPPKPVAVKAANEFRFDVGVTMGAEAYQGRSFVFGRGGSNLRTARDRAIEKANPRTYGDRWETWYKRAISYGQLGFAGRGPVLVDPSRSRNGRVTLDGERVPNRAVMYGQAFAVQAFAATREQARSCVEAAFDGGIDIGLFTGYRIEPFDPFRGEGCAIAIELNRLRETHSSNSPDVRPTASSPGVVPPLEAESEPRYILGDYGERYPAGFIWADLDPSPVPGVVAGRVEASPAPRQS